MPNTASEASNLHALLIGINCYRPNRLSDGTFYRSLLGCVPDILHVEQFLRKHLGLTDERLIRLTASLAPDSSDPAEPPEQWPTYRNIIESFRKLTGAARPGDQVYIHYSGHGGRTPTLPAHRRAIPGKVVDETLVPTDIGNSEAQYLRDIELAFLLREMVEKGLFVTVVLDSCHSGSATRDGAVLRGSSTVDTTPRPAVSLVAADDALAEAWQRAAAAATRDVEVGSGWLPDPRGYVLLAACGAHEGAYEFPFENGQKRGALTYWLLDALKELGLGVTYRTVYRQLYAKIHTQFKAQTPQLEGEGDRVVFGRDSVARPHAFTVMCVAEGGRELTINAGRVHRVGRGARLAVFRAGAADGSRASATVVEVGEPGVASSPARVVGPHGADEIRQGDEAVLLVPGTDAAPRVVGLPRPESPAAHAAPAAEVARLLRQRGGGYVRSALPGEAADFHVSVNERGEYLILDAGRRPFQNLGPALRAGDGAAAPKLIERLLHLSKYLNLRELENRDAQSALVHDVSAELVWAHAARGENGGAHAGSGPAAAHALRAGDWVSLRVRNGGGQTLNVTVLDLRPDWSVAQIFPSRAGLFETLGAGQELFVPLRADLPPGYEEGDDLIKVFVTTGAVDFKCFQLPPLDTPPATPPHALRTPPAAEPTPADPAPTTRDMSAPRGPEEDWAALDREVSVRRG